MLKQEMKKYLLESIDLCFEKLYEMLNPESDYYNDIIHLKMRYTRVMDDKHKGTITNEDRNLELNRVQIALIEYVDKLGEGDFGNYSDDRNNTGIDENKFTHFWKPFFETKTTIVIGTYDDERLRAWEASTLMGTGDGIALGIIMGVLNNVGITNIDVVPTYNFTGDRYQNNLIILGGPDANKLSRQIYGRLDTKLKFGNPDLNEITLYDSEQEINYQPKIDGANRVSKDYGFIFRSENPFNTESSVILLAGCYGFGTCAAAKFFESTKLLNAVNKSPKNGFEAIVSSDVINDWVQKPKLINSYEL